MSDYVTQGRQWVDFDPHAPPFMIETSNSCESRFIAFGWVIYHRGVHIISAIVKVDTFV